MSSKNMAQDSRRRREFDLTTVGGYRIRKKYPNGSGIYQQEQPATQKAATPSNMECEE
jgi:hypothetical protein